MRYLIPDTDTPNADLFRTVIEDWIEVNPEDTFEAQHPAITYLIHSQFPSHLAEDHDQIWHGFWDGYLPGDDQVPSDDFEDAGMILSSGMVLNNDDLDLIYQALLPRLSEAFSRLEDVTPTRQTSDA